MVMKVMMHDKKVADEANQVQALMKGIDEGHGALFCSDYTYPGRYGKWMMGFTESFLMFRAEGRSFEIQMLDDCKGMMESIVDALASRTDIQDLQFSDRLVKGRASHSCPQDHIIVTEEDRGRRSSIFNVLRVLIGLFDSSDAHFGFQGAFGYDLAHQFEDIEESKKRATGYPDLVLYLPKNLYLKGEGDRIGTVREYMVGHDDFGVEMNLASKPGYEKELEPAIGCSIAEVGIHRPYGQGDYAKVVERSLPSFAAGDLFEVVPSYERCRTVTAKPSTLFQTLRTVNPSPYAFFINLGGEHLVGASPEMYVRVNDTRVETCPISGTISRGRNAMEDSEQIKKLLNSEKEESELTMCTDVDRNDKSRICDPATVKIIGRRQIEMYSHLIHTVDHVEGQLREDYDGLDAFMSHMWAVTVTGAPKKAAMQWIENHEETPRRWYGGAVGNVAIDGSVNTGLTLRTMRIVGDKAYIRVGATLLHGCDPTSEEEETVLKAKALERVIDICEAGVHVNGEDGSSAQGSSAHIADGGHTESESDSLRVLFIDHEDSFVHTLAGYFRACGCEITTVRHQVAAEMMQKNDYDLMVLSPGPGTPQDFNLSKHISLAVEKKMPVFGVCLGLQGIIEHFGGRLGRLETPYHGKKSMVGLTEAGQSSKLFKGLSDSIEVGRYHSLYADTVPAELVVTARTSCGIPMAIESNESAVYAVQFHPESLMSASEGQGMTIIRNLLEVAMEHKKKQLRVFDCTLRDGGLTNDFDFTAERIRAHVIAMAESGVDVVELGYKASREPGEEMGALKYCDESELHEILGSVVDDVRDKMSFAFMVDVGRVDINTFPPSEKSIFSIARVACYLKQVNEALVMVKHLKSLGYETFINIMAISEQELESLEEPLKAISEEADVDGVYLVDSFGAMLPEVARAYAATYKRILNGKTLGIHAHDNLQLALANTLEMRGYGFTCFDGSVAGMGRGGGNAPLELLLSIIRPEDSEISPVLTLMDTYHVDCPRSNRHMRTKQMLTGMYNVHPTKFLPDDMKTGSEANAYFIRNKRTIKVTHAIKVNRRGA